MATPPNIPSVFEGEILKVRIRNTSISEPVEFQIHKQLLSNLSPYFRALPNFSEGQTGILELNDMCPEAFRFIVNWMYSRKFPTKNTAELSVVLIRAWAVADRLMMTECKNNIMDELQSQWRDNYIHDKSLQHVNLLGLTPDRAIVRAVKDAWIGDFFDSQPDMEDLEIAVEKVFQLDACFARDVVITMLSRSMKLTERTRCAMELSGVSKENAECQYHEHLNDEVCKLSKSSED